MDISNPIIKTKKQAKEMGYCVEHVLLNKYGRVPKTQGIVVKNEIFFKPELEELAKTRTAWKKEARRIKDGVEPVGVRHFDYRTRFSYDVYRECDTEIISQDSNTIDSAEN
jgi:hypothetical protein